MSNKHLHKAKTNKNDEFYTQTADIEKELKYYKDNFENKIVYCNCDDPRKSNFTKYFQNNFKKLKLKKVISTYLDSKGNGDFRSPECIEFLKESDVVVTNPPFSLFREYVAQLVEYDKNFLIIGYQNAIGYKKIFPLIKENKLWLGYNRVKNFDQPDGVVKKMGNVLWFTNLKHKKRNEDLCLCKKYTPEEYHKYDNYNAINVNLVKEIPEDYLGVMGVPITFMYKYNPEQFEIIKFRKGDDDKDLSVNGKYPYYRILIKRKTNK